MRKTDEGTEPPDLLRHGRPPTPTASERSARALIPRHLRPDPVPMPIRILILASLASACATASSGPSPPSRHAPRGPVTWDYVPPSPAEKRARERYAYYCVGQTSGLPRAYSAGPPIGRKRSGAPVPKLTHKPPPKPLTSTSDISLPCTDACCFGRYLCDEVRRGKRATAGERAWCEENRPPPPPR